jgi:hypothetical protein
VSGATSATIIMVRDRRPVRRPIPGLRHPTARQAAARAGIARERRSVDPAACIHDVAEKSRAPSGCRARVALESSPDCPMPMARSIVCFVRLRRQPRGYHIRYEIVDYPNGMPGDIGIMLRGA